LPTFGLNLSKKFRICFCVSDIVADNSFDYAYHLYVESVSFADLCVQKQDNPPVRPAVAHMSTGGRHRLRSRQFVASFSYFIWAHLYIYHVVDWSHMSTPLQFEKDWTSLNSTLFALCLKVCFECVFWSNKAQKSAKESAREQRAAKKREVRRERDKQKAKEYVETMAEYRKNAINYHKKWQLRLGWFIFYTFIHKHYNNSNNNC